MRLRDTVQGTLGLFGTSPGTLDTDDLALAQALANVANVANVDETSAADRIVVNTPLQHALTSRILIEQAKGILAHLRKLDMDGAVTVLRRYARDHGDHGDHGDKLSDVARRIVNPDPRGEKLLNHATSAATQP